MNSSTQTEGATYTLGRRGTHGTYNGCMLFHGERGVCQFYALPQNTDAEEIAKEPRYAVQWEEAVRIARAANAFPDLVAALQEAERLLSNITQLSQPRHAVQVGDLVRCADAAAQQARAALTKAKA